jgi:HD superfamily phosphohydrolase
MTMRARVFRDPVHGLIAFSGEDAGLARVLDTRAFQRLRRIRQDGFASLVYPGAEHSRFGHALGAFHVASRVTARLGVPPRVALDVKAAALVHDIGHGPFSHAWEAALGSLRHEAWGARILDEDAELRAALTEISGELPAALVAIAGGRYRPRYARRLVSSQLDVDRMDYLLRDAHFCGVGYSAYDLDWMIHALNIAAVRPGDDPFDLVVDYGRGLNALAQFLVGRSNMYAQVYYHKTVRAAEWMFTRVMERFALLAARGGEPPGLAAAGKLARGEAISVDEYLRLDDVRVWCALEDWGGGATRDPVLADLARRLTRRRLFKAIDIGDDAARAERLAPALAAAAAGVFGADGASYYALDAATREVVDPQDELYVVGHPRHGTLPLSRLVSELPLGRPVTTCRVLCAPELLEAFRPICAGA